MQRADQDAAARRRRLHGVGDQVAIDPVQREEVAFDVDRFRCQLRRHATGRRWRLSCIIESTRSATVLVDVDGEALDRHRLGHVAQIVEHAFDLRQLALDGPPEAFAVLRVVPHLQNELAAVADVLNRVREVVHEADGDAAEHRVPLFLAHVLLQLDEPSAMRVEGRSELTELVARCDRDTRVEPSLARARACRA